MFVIRMAMSCAFSGGCELWRQERVHRPVPPVSVQEPVRAREPLINFSFVISSEADRPFLGDSAESRNLCRFSLNQSFPRSGRFVFGRGLVGKAALARREPARNLLFCDV